MALQKYVHEKVFPIIAKKLTLCYVRVRCPCCGMWTRLDNLKRDQPLYEESACYSRGDAGFYHQKYVNNDLKGFWIKHLNKVLARMGYEVVEKSLLHEAMMSYQHHRVANFAAVVVPYRGEKEVTYEHAK